MTVQTVKSQTSNVEKFQNSEQLWFWFLYSRSVQKGFRMGNFSTQKRICELLDVETLVTKLYLCGKLNDKQLSVMKEFGDKRRAPHQHIWSENRKAAIWRDAMRTLQTAAATKGWIID